MSKNRNTHNHSASTFRAPGHRRMLYFVGGLAGVVVLAVVLMEVLKPAASCAGRESASSQAPAPPASVVTPQVGIAQSPGEVGRQVPESCFSVTNWVDEGPEGASGGIQQWDRERNQRRMREEWSEDLVRSVGGLCVAEVAEEKEP